MKAAVLRGFGEPLVLEDVPQPEPGPEDVLIRVHACGVDGTDLKLLEGFGYKPTLPFIMGHEPAGVVAAVGDRVQHVKPGDHAITYNFYSCGVCRPCRTYREQICPNMTAVLGVKGVPGAYAEYLCVPERQVIVAPRELNFADAAVHCDAGVTAYHAVDRSRLTLGEVAIIFGVGGVGSYAVQFAKMSGATVIAVDQTDAKCRRAIELGADMSLNSQSDDIRSIVEEKFSGGVDCVIDVVGLEATLSTGVDCLTNGGRLVIVGYTPDEYALSGKRLAQGELEILGTRCGRKQDLINAVQLAAAGRTQSIVTDRFRLEDVNAAHDRLRSGEVLGRLVLELAD